MYFKIKLKRIPLNPQTREVDLVKMRKAITRNTCLVSDNWNSFWNDHLCDVCLVGSIGTKFSSWCNWSYRRNFSSNKKTIVL